MDEHQGGPAGSPSAGPPDAEFSATELAGVGPPSASVGDVGRTWQPPGSFARGGRGSRLLGGVSGTVISTASTLVVLGALVAVFLLAPGARAVEHAFFNPQDMWASFVGDPQKGYYSVGAAIWLNIRMFVAAEVLILVLALLVALVRQSSHPALFPIRILATGYVDLFRGVPLILVIFAIGLGVPALSLPVVSNQSNAVYGVTALVLSYSAYVSEVYRAGLNSVHQGQVAAARSLGLPQRQALRYVILPQAVRNIIPPLLNDFISLQKDTALVGILGTIEANKAADIYSEQVFNFSSFTVAGDEAVRIEGLHKSFGTNEVLKGIDLSVATHEVVCLIGASGSGKSTLLRCVNLLEPIDSGRISLWGQEITAPGIDPNLVRRHVGIVFQSFNLFPHMTVLSNVTLAPTKVRRVSPAQANEDARALLARFGLADKEADFPDRLSGGQQQRVAIVRALAMRPQLMLLDEVTSALDPELVAEVLDVIRELAATGMTMIIATHEMGFARDIARRVCFLEEGRIIEDAPPAELVTSPRDERTRRFLRRIVDAGRL